MNRQPRHPSDDGAPVLSAQGWSVGLFCAECSHHWTGAAPCTNCGRFSRPVVTSCREVLCGKSWAPWTWEKRYQFRQPTAQGKAPASAPPRDRAGTADREPEPSGRNSMAWG